MAPRPLKGNDLREFVAKHRTKLNLDQLAKGAGYYKVTEEGEMRVQRRSFETALVHTILEGAEG